jgi:hypothetical protein
VEYARGIEGVSRIVFGEGVTEQAEVVAQVLDRFLWICVAVGKLRAMIILREREHMKM